MYSFTGIQLYFGHQKSARIFPNESDWNIELSGHQFYGNPARIFPKESDWNVGTFFLRESSYIEDTKNQHGSS